MNTLDKITRDSRILIDCVKDTVTKNITSEVLNRKIALDENQLADILKIVEISCDEGYQKAYNVFQRTIKSHLET